MSMRTTLTLEPDVARAVDRLRARRKATLKEIVNEGLRIGLAELERPRRRRRFRTKVVTLAPRASNVDDVAEVLAIAEGDDLR